MTNPMRYKIQQDKGEYALKGCTDGDLVDYSAYEVLRGNLSLAEEGLANYAQELARMQERCVEFSANLTIAERQVTEARMELDRRSAEPNSAPSAAVQVAAGPSNEGPGPATVGAVHTQECEYAQGECTCGAEKSNPAQCGCDTEDPYCCSKAKPHEHEPCYCQCHKL